MDYSELLESIIDNAAYCHISKTDKNLGLCHFLAPKITYLIRRFYENDGEEWIKLDSIKFADYKMNSDTFEKLISNYNYNNLSIFNLNTWIIKEYKQYLNIKSIQSQSSANILARFNYKAL